MSVFVFPFVLKEWAMVLARYNALIAQGKGETEGRRYSLSAKHFNCVMGRRNSRHNDKIVGFVCLEKEWVNRQSFNQKSWQFNEKLCVTGIPENRWEFINQIK